MSTALYFITLLAAVAAEVQTRETPTTRLFVQTTPPGAAINLDGKSEGTTPKVFVVPPGATKMIVEVELDGHASQRREVTIQSGRVTRIEFQLEPSTGTAAPPANQASTHVYALKHISAAEAARVLRQAFSDKFGNKPLQENSWVSLGSGRAPKL